MSGTASEKLFGMAESLWEPDLPAEDLFETVSQTLLNAVDRDAYSGWGAVVWLIEKVGFDFRRVVPRSLEEGPRGAHSGATLRQARRLWPGRKNRKVRVLTSSWLILQDKVTKRWLKARMD